MYVFYNETHVYANKIIGSWKLTSYKQKLVSLSSSFRKNRKQEIYVFGHQKLQEVFYAYITSYT